MGLTISEEVLGMNLVQCVDRGQPQTSLAQAAPEVQVDMNSCKAEANHCHPIIPMAP